MSSPLVDGCPEFDEHLMDLAVQPVARPEVEAHVATCRRCQEALEQYRETERAISAALTTLGGPMQQTPAASSPIDRIVSLGAAMVLAAAAVFLATTRISDAEPPPISVHPDIGAVVQLLGPDHARIEEGTSRFVIRHSSSVVETPIGMFSCDSCEFTVSVGQCVGMTIQPYQPCDPSQTCVMISVSSGLLASSLLDRSFPMGPGQSLTWPMMGVRSFDSYR